MKKLFVDYDEALELKNLGYDIPCFGSYLEDKTLDIGGIRYKVTPSECVLAPTYQQAFKWFRKEHGLYSGITPKKSWPDNVVTGVEWYVEICGGDGKEVGPDGTYSYKEAEIACLKKLIDLIKNLMNYNI